MHKLTVPLITTTLCRAGLGVVGGAKADYDRGHPQGGSACLQGMMAGASAPLCAQVDQAWQAYRPALQAAARRPLGGCPLPRCRLGQLKQSWQSLPLALQAMARRP